jgi:type I restriction enzyme S subunit
LLTAKKSTLETYKKGVMQKLFPKAGQTNPELRFKRPDGSSFPDWEERTVGEFLTESRIKGSSGDNAEKLTVKLWGKGVFAKHDITEGSPQTQYYKRKAGQFIYSKLDFLNCAFGIIPNELDGRESTVDLPCFEINNRLVPYWLLSLVTQKRFYKRLGETADGSRKAKRIHANTFCEFPLFVPTIDEQQRIVDFLLSIDQKQEMLEMELGKMKGFKKGLLQQMFV